MATEPVPPETLHPWAIYLQASEEARRRGDRRAGTDHILLALFEDPSTEGLLGVSLQQARQALDLLDRQALGAVGLGPGADAPELPMHAVPKKPTLKYLMLQKDRLRMSPAAKKVLEQAAKPNRIKSQVTARQVLAQILTLQPPDPAAALMGALGVNASELRRRLNMRSQAGQETSGDGAVPFNGQARG
jgi:ATP-dependent Clp protease ATP-binding subunit ClpA